MDKGLEKCSTSTDVEPVHNPSQKVAKRKLDNLEIKEKRKKQKKHNERSEENKRMEKSEEQEEIEKLRKSLKEMTETVKELQEIIQTKAITAFSPTREPREKFECNFGNKDHLGTWTLFVEGFDKNLPRLVIKNALWKHFSSCGKVYRVYVPIECGSGVVLGFAFIDLKDEISGLKLNGSVLGGRKLSVMMAKMAKRRDESSGFKGFQGCRRCWNYKLPYVKGASHILWPSTYYEWTPPVVVGSRFSKIGRFTGVICRLRSRSRS